MDASPTAPKDWRDPAFYNDVFKVRPGPAFLGSWQEVFGDDYPAELEPYSFVTKTDLVRIVRFLAISPGNVLVDLGCGRGGAGLWLARETGANLIGIDLSPNAVLQAGQRIEAFGLSARARFQAADVCATGLADQSCDAAVSIDVMQFVPDIPGAMREAGRVLRRGRPFVFTAFDMLDTDYYRSPLQAAGFNIELYEEKPGWRPRQLAVYERLLARQEAVMAELGEAGRTVIAEAGDCIAGGLNGTRHMFLVARKL